MGMLMRRNQEFIKAKESLNEKPVQRKPKKEIKDTLPDTKKTTKKTNLDKNGDLQLSFKKEDKK